MVCKLAQASRRCTPHACRILCSASLEVSRTSRLRQGTNWTNFKDLATLATLLCIAASHALRGPAVHRSRRLPRRATALDSLDKAVDNTLNTTRSWGPARQAGVVLATYAAHAGALGRGSVLLPYQLVPNEFGLWQSVGFDSLLGFSFLGLHFIRRTKGTSRRRELPPAPEIGKRALITTIGALAVAYRWSGYVAALVDGFVYRATPTATPAMGRALQVLGGHLAWLVVGVSVLAVVPALEVRNNRLRWNRDEPRGNEPSTSRRWRGGRRRIPAQAKRPRPGTASSGRPTGSGGSPAATARPP